MNITRDIQTLSEFKQNASKLIKQVQETRQPVVLTVNGVPAAVVQDPDSYQRMVDEREIYQSVKVLKQRFADKGDESKWVPHDTAFALVREKFGIEKPKGK